FSPRNKCSNTSPYEKRSFFFTFKKVIFELFSDKWDLLDSPLQKRGGEGFECQGCPRNILGQPRKCFTGLSEDDLN
ncbi:MAG: hypothetical protein WAQ10_06305, partial [Dethiobacteria bacterium]